jgi:hypothetical protein
MDVAGPVPDGLLADLAAVPEVLGVSAADLTDGPS